MKRILLLVISLCIINAFPSYSQTDNRPTIAVALFTIENTEPTIAKVVAENIITYIVDMNKFNVIERTQLERVLREAQLSNSDLMERNNTVRIGKLLSAKGVIIGSIITFGSTTTITARLVETESGRIIKSAREEIYRDNQIAGACKNIAQKLVGVYRESITQPNEESSTESRINRRNDEGNLTGTDSEVNNTSAITRNFHGIWNTNSNEVGRIKIIQRGTKVTGTYEYNEGEFSGNITGNKLTIEFRDRRRAGDGSFIMSSNGKQLIGRFVWRYAFYVNFIATRQGTSTERGQDEAASFGSNSYAQAFVGYWKWLKGGRRIFLHVFSNGRFTIIGNPGGVNRGTFSLDSGTVSLTADNGVYIGSFRIIKMTATNMTTLWKNDTRVFVRTMSGEY